MLLITTLEPVQYSSGLERDSERCRQFIFLDVMRILHIRSRDSVAFYVG